MRSLILSHAFRRSALNNTQSAKRIPNASLHSTTATKNAEAKRLAGNYAFLERAAKPQLILPNAQRPRDALVNSLPLLSLLLRTALKSIARRRSKHAKMIEDALLP